MIFKKTSRYMFALAGILLTSTTAMAADIDPAINARSNQDAQLIYTEKNPNIIVTSSHPEFTIKLKSNPTTGYSWSLRNVDTALVVSKKHHFHKNRGKLIGAPGFELWSFKIKPKGFSAPQQTTINFVYVRPWEPAKIASQVVFNVTTQVESGVN